MASPRVVYPDSVWVVLVTTGRYESPSDAPDRVAKNALNYEFDQKIRFFYRKFSQNLKGPLKFENYSVLFEECLI